MRPFHQNWERWLFYSGTETNTEKERNVFQAKQDTTPEKDLNDKLFIRKKNSK